MDLVSFWGSSPLLLINQAVKTLLCLLELSRHLPREWDLQG